LVNPFSRGFVYVTAGRLLVTIQTRFSEFGIPFELSTNIIPDDSSTLFICAGMQPLKPKFQNPDGTSYGNIQYCVRTNDIEEVGDGTHLTFFKMVGSFGFGTNNYPMHVDLWHSIIDDLGLYHIIHYHPDSTHQPLWLRHQCVTLPNPDCVWSDGNVGGYCSEVLVDDLEIGNLVNPLGHSVDVGFGFERLLQVVEGVSRVDQTEEFRQDLDPVSRDHYRTLTIFHEQGIVPGNKGRPYVCRRILRRFIRLNPEFSEGPFLEWLKPEKDRLQKCIIESRRYYRRNQDKSPEFWWDTFGLLPEELELLRY
jgi:alanyl-tRNA synthetase